MEKFKKDNDRITIYKETIKKQEKVIRKIGESDERWHGLS
jgi:hypothetical protein